MSSYFESCFDCDGYKIGYRFLRKDPIEGNVYEATCRDCGASWETTEAEED